MTHSRAVLRPHQVDAAVPRWFGGVVGAFACAVIGFGLSGLVLALIGWFRIGPGLAIGIALSYSLFAQWFPTQHRRRSSVRVQLPAVVAALIAVASLLFNWSAAAETYTTDTEVGVMVNAARHLDITGSLTVDASIGPFEQARVGFVADGFVGSGVGGTLVSDVAHLVPVYRGIAGWFGQTPLLAVGAVFGAAALMAFYWLAARIVPPWLAAASTAVMSVTMPFVYASRLFLPDLVTFFSVMAALALLWGLPETLVPWRGALVGLLLGMGVLARPQWAVVSVAVGLFVVSEFIRSTKLSWSEARKHRRLLAAGVGGFAIPVLLSVADASLTSLDLTATFEPRRIVAAVVLSAVVFGVLRFSSRALGEQPRLAYADVRQALAFLAAGALIVGCAVMLLRPAVTTTDPSPLVAEVQLAEGVDVDPTRTYDESTGWWLVWYLGPLGVAAGIGGLALLIVDTAEVSARRMVPFLGVTVVLGLATVIDAGPEPIQALAARRLIVVAIPALIIGAAALVHRLHLALPSGATPLAWALGIGAMAVAIVPLLQLRSVADLSSHRGQRGGIEQLCAQLGRSDAVLFVEEASDSIGTVAVQTVRGFCRVPAARAIAPSADEVERLAAAWRAEGRSLMLISAKPLPDPAAVTAVPLAWESLERTVESRPDAAELGSLVLYVAPSE